MSLWSGRTGCGHLTEKGRRKPVILHHSPVELPLRCIKLFSFIGDTVLDPFMGSGSTLVAASQCNRKGIGIEIDPGYCQTAVSRLKKEEKRD